MSTRILKLASLSVLILFTQACSHPIEIVGEGDVTSHSGNRNCSLEQFRNKESVCTKNNTDIDLARLPELIAKDYVETYNPAPRPGWRFARWENYCSNATPPNYDCSFNISAATIQPYLGRTMPALKAVFCLINDMDCDGLLDPVDPCPANPTTSPCALITGDDIVTVNEKQWAKPDLFINLSWNKMNAACPSSKGGKCTVGAVLKGKDLTGWTWAGWRDVASLYNSFGALVPTDVPGGINEQNSEWAPAVYAAGFRHTLTDDFPPITFRTIYFYLPLDLSAGITAGSYAGSQDYVDPESWDYAGTNPGATHPDAEGGVGMLLHRTIP